MQQYLARYAEPEAALYSKAINSSFEHVLVVPLYDEALTCLDSLLEWHRDTNVLVIAVVNTPDNAPHDATANTRALLQHLSYLPNPNVLLVDRVSQPLPHKSAVGLARKIGTDIALAAFCQNRIISPWLYQTDADVVLPANYFSASAPALLKDKPNKGAMVFSHQHTSSDVLLEQAARLYEQHMQYYVRGLSEAGSMYAYPTLGSTLAIHVATYATVRGFPKRDAAEDFYLLNKVAKVHGVHYLPQVQLKIAARKSHRVPFGTGPALEKIMVGLRNDPSGNFYRSYHPESFVLLRDTLSYLNELAEQPTSKISHYPAPQTQRLTCLLKSFGFEKVAQTIAKQYKTSQRRRQAFSDWFDAGKTLRFINAARRYYPDLPLLETLKTLSAEGRRPI